MAELVTGALAKLVTKLGCHQLVGEYNLQRGVQGGIRFLQSELESMQAALETISEVPANQLDKQNNIWARYIRELSYDIEDCIDTFMVVTLSRSKHSKDSENVGVHGFIKMLVRRCCDFLAQFGIRRDIATEIRKIKRNVKEVCDRRDRYEIANDVAKPITVRIDPRLLDQYKDNELVGITEARDELIQMLTEGDDVSMSQGKILSIVGFGGLGKTTLANAVYEKISSQFDCRAFVSVSQTPDVKKVFNAILYEFGKIVNDEITDDDRLLINELRHYLHEKRYFIVIDDIWDMSVWEIIKCALPHNNCGYRIITTTRILNIAEQVGCPYKMKPLSLNNSKTLFYSRILGSEGNDNNYKQKYLDEELTEVSLQILKKCAGVPLAIVTIASLLASKRRCKLEWYEVCNSIGTGLENSLDVENMRMILSLSYYDMPSHLRTCLLYLTVFPEDYKIGKNRLIRMWIAEGFIRCENQVKNLFKLGESYFLELINRSMVQPLYDKYSGMIEQCCLHDMVLDLIRLFSSEERFINILNGMDHTPQSQRVRRLCVQNGEVDVATIHYEKVRSLVFAHTTVSHMPGIRKFRVLRVLDLPGCDLSQCRTLKHIGKLCHLRYLGLRCTRISQLPKAIGNLVLLQTLDVTANHIRTLPTTFVWLRNLTCLHMDGWTEVPRSFRKLRSLEQLSRFAINKSVDNIKELGHLTGLRELCIVGGTEQNNILEKSLVECLSKLIKLQTLSFWASSGSGNLDAWIAPQHLRKLDLVGCWFSMLPSWMDPSLLLDLSFLSISFNEPG